jgi:hypothetical protein
MSDVSFRISDIASTGTLMARYELANEQRDVMAFNANGEISLFDVPVPANGSIGLLIERGLFFWEDSLRSLVLDYVERSEQLGSPAVSEEAVGGASAELADVLRLEAQRIAA